MSRCLHVNRERPQGVPHTPRDVGNFIALADAICVCRGDFFTACARALKVRADMNIGHKAFVLFLDIIVQAHPVGVSSLVGFAAVGGAVEDSLIDLEVDEPIVGWETPQKEENSPVKEGGTYQKVGLAGKPALVGDYKPHTGADGALLPKEARPKGILGGLAWDKAQEGEPGDTEFVLSFSVREGYYLARWQDDLVKDE